MSLGKKIIASLAALTLAVSASGCGTGKGTAWAARYEDYEVNAGIFIYYEMSAYYEAANKAKEADENLDTTDKKALKASVIDGKDMLTWIQDDATDNLRKYLAVQAEFDNRGLELTQEEIDEINESVDGSWDYYGSYYEENGIGKESFKKITELSYKSEALFKSYYGEGGTDEVSMDTVKDYYDENYARVKYITLSLNDTDGNALDDDTKAERKKMAEEFVERANKGENFDSLIAEYDEYIAKLAEEAAAAETAETEAAETTAETESEETTAETSVSAENTDETAEALESEEVTVTEAEAANDEAKETAETEASKNETAETEETSAETKVSEEKTAETEETSAGTDESEETAETEENSYANEKIIKKGSDDSYTPSEKVNKAIFEAEQGKAFFVDDSDENSNYYVVVRYDILERTDLFEGDGLTSILREIKGDEYDEKLLAIVTLENIVKNQSAYKRYNPFDFEV
ncbi:MAG: hypothetical protein ACI4JM_06085 [Oscillospiraceae bacterium]